MPKYYICISPSDSLTVGRKYVSYQPEDGGNPHATWVNVVDDTGWIHSHDKELFKKLEEFREEAINNIFKD
jgi:hypothetical protein